MFKRSCFERILHQYTPRTATGKTSPKLAKEPHTICKLRSARSADSSTSDPSRALGYPRLLWASPLLQLFSRRTRSLQGPPICNALHQCRVSEARLLPRGCRREASHLRAVRRNTEGGNSLLPHQVSELPKRRAFLEAILFMYGNVSGCRRGRVRQCGDALRLLYRAGRRAR
jgi:hypothetical protein